MEDQLRLDVTVVPLTVHFEEESFYDGIEITAEEFYRRLDHAQTLPTTSMVPPERFQTLFSECLAAGDEVLGLFISSEISGTYHAACIAKESFPGADIVVMDSRSASMSLALLVAEAVRYRDAGESAAEIAAKLEPLIQKVRFLAAVDTLKYLRKGGRISATSAIVGEMLGIKPIVTIENGVIYSIGKARGMQAAMRHLIAEAKKHVPDLRHNFVFAHSGAPELFERAISCMKEPLKVKEWISCELGAIIGTYAGRGCIGIAFIAE